MKVNNIKILFLSLLAAAFICSCNKDDSPFSGTDNNISSFQLKQGELTLNAAVSGGSIVLTAPENISLEGATAIVIISENASIEPDPSSITNWNDTQTFTVTAYNGTKSTYSYHVERSVISKDGDIVLLTQADVESLAALELTQINGSLTIGAATGKDSVYSLVPLAGLKTIKYDLIINATYAGTDLSGLENLEKAGSLQMIQVKKLKTADFPKLNVVMSDLIVNQVPLTFIKFPELTKIDRGLQVLNTDSLVTMEFPKLQSVVENITMQGGWSTNKLQSVDFPVLEKVGGKLNISNWKEALSISFPKLQQCESLSVSSCNKLEKLLFPALIKIDGAISYSLTAANVTDISFASLSIVGGDFTINAYPNVEGFEWIKSLTKVNGTLSFRDLDCSDLSQVTPALSEVKRLVIYSLPNLSIVDLTKLKIETISFEGTSNPTEIRANETCVTNLQFGYLNISELPSLSGIKHLKGLYVSGCNKLTTVALDGIESIENDLMFEYGQLCMSYKMPALERVGGKFTFMNQFATEFYFPILKEVGAFTYHSQGQSTPVHISFPLLERSETYFQVQTSGNTSIVASMSFPKLVYVGDYFQIRAFSNPENNYIENLDTFSELTYIGGTVYIEAQKALISYEGLKNALSKVLAGESTWTVRNNGYNPTVDDLKLGKWTKE